MTISHSRAGPRTRGRPTQKGATQVGCHGWEGRRIRVYSDRKTWAGRTRLANQAGPTATIMAISSTAGMHNKICTLGNTDDDPIPSSLANRTTHRGPR